MGLTQRGETQKMLFLMAVIKYSTPMGNELIKAPTDAGYDLRNAEESKTLESGSFMLLDTKTRVKMPKDFYAMVCSKSGLAAKKGVFVLNAPGIIDPLYVDDIKVILCNLGKDSVLIEHNEKIAELIFVKKPKLKMVAVSDEIDNKESRGGFGSTGRF